MQYEKDHRTSKDRVITKTRGEVPPTNKQVQNETASMVQSKDERLKRGKIKHDQSNPYQPQLWDSV